MSILSSSPSELDLAKFEELRRFDLESDFKIVDEEKRLVQVVSLPHPDRYEHIKKDGKSFYLDKYFDEMFQLEDMVIGAMGSPIYASDRAIDSTEEYAELRHAAMRTEIETGDHVPPEKIAGTLKVLKASEASKLLSFICVDVVGSTALRAFHGTDFDKSFEFLVKEIGNLAAVFGASILKVTGDGVIIYVDHPSFNIAADTTNDLASSILQFMDHTFRPALRDAQLPVFDLRIGADMGPAIVKDFVVPATSFKQLDIASDALNRASKLEEIAPKNTLRIGWHLYRLSHIEWLKRAKPVEERIDGLEDYEVFALS